MAFSFRISSFDFNLFDFSAGDKETNDLPKQDILPMPDFTALESESDALLPNFDFANKILLQDSESNINDKSNEINTEDYNDSEVEKVETKPVHKKAVVIKEEQPTQSVNENTFDPSILEDGGAQIEILFRRLFREEFQEVQGKYTTRMSFQFSHKDFVDNQIYLNRNKPTNSLEIETDQEKHYEKEKEKQEKNNIEREEQRKKTK